MKHNIIISMLHSLLLLLFLPVHVLGVNPTVEEVDGINAVSFNGSDMFLKSTFLTDSRYNGTSDWTVIVKAYTTDLGGGERPMFSWAARGGPGSSCAQMNYHSGGTGAIVHWGADNAWYAGTTTGPVANEWHYLAITYAGGGTTDEYFYVDSILTNWQVRTLNLKTDNAMYLGTVMEANGTFTKWYPGSIARLHVYDYALTPEEIADISDESEEIGNQPPMIRLEAEDLDEGELDFWNNEGTIGKGFGELAVVTNVAATQGTYYNKIKVTWDAYDATGTKVYTVYRANDDMTSIAEPIGVVTNLTEYDDMAVALDELYYYWIRVEFERGLTDFSLSDSGYIIPRLYSPRQVAASYELYAGKIDVAWQTVGAATKYVVYRNTVNNAASATDTSGEITTTTFTDTEPTDPDQVFYYWVKAGDASDAWSTFSDAASGKLQSGPQVGWPMYSADAQSKGYNNGPNELTTAELVWSNGFKGYNLRSPVLDGDTIYLGCWPEDDAADSTDLFAVNLSDGSIKYKVDLPYPVYGGAAVYGDKLFVGEYGDAYNTHLYCLDKHTGTILWSKKLDYHYCTSAPKIHDGMLYVDAGSWPDPSSIYCMNPVNGDTIWRFYDQGLRAFYWGGGEPAISADGAYVAYRGETPSHVGCINNSDGSTNWLNATYDHPYPNENLLFDSNGNIYTPAKDGSSFVIVKYNGTDGTELWKSPSIGDGSSWPTWQLYGQVSVAINSAEDTVYIALSRGATDGLVAVNAANGSIKWTITSSTLGHGEAPLVTGSGNMIMGVCGDKNADPFVIKAFGVKDNGVNGTVSWTIPLPGPNDMDPFTPDALQWDDWPSDTSPALTKDGNLVVTTRGGILALIRPPDSVPEVPGVDASNDQTDKIAVAWSTSTGAESYQLYRSQNPADPNPLAIGSVTTATSYDDTAVTAEVPYYYWVKAHNTNGWSDYSPLDEGFMLNAAGITISNVNFAYGNGTVSTPYDFFSAASLPIETRKLNVTISGGNVYDLTVTRTGGSGAFSADCEAYVNDGGSTDLTVTYISDGSNTMFQPAEFTIQASNIDPVTVYVQDTPEPGVACALLIGLILLARKLR